MGLESLNGLASDGGVALRVAGLCCCDLPETLTWTLPEGGANPAVFALHEGCVSVCTYEAYVWLYLLGSGSYNIFSQFIGCPEIGMYP